MTNRKLSAETVLLGVAIALSALAGAVVAIDALPFAIDRETQESFQRLVGGLGMGPAVDLSPCMRNFDPRLNPHCSLDDGPIPGGMSW